MTSLDDAGLDVRRRALVDAALRADPALGAELESIAALFGSGARARFWAAFADGCEGSGRPAAAVLPALERAAGIDG